ncbi:MAG: bifunctional diaminohydroxyphosphoribosylaminopyrimidine deaminase/5-amino-6-(5-phosphoribosylamino)uracil reductase RibD [Rubrobacteraceae bacterium]
MARSVLMDRARDLAERGRYTAAPNPLVGSVVVRGDQVIGEGWHVQTGDDHAEVAALKATEIDTRGAEMYVTLEPCNHHGRTPPCTDAIIQAGISKVVIGHLDPDPRMHGRSVALLRDAGVEVEVLQDPELKRQNEQFFTKMQKNRPFVHLKLAATLDGRIAASTGDSKWITGDSARLRARGLRAEAGAVLVGAGTVRADDPLLTVRNGHEKPITLTRAVLDPQLTTSPESQLAQTAHHSPVVLFAGIEASGERAKRLADLGVDVAPVPLSEYGLNLDAVLVELKRRGVRGVLVEGGGETAARFIDKGLVDKLTVFYAPRIIGAEGVPMVGKLRLTRMADAAGLVVSGVELVGGDLAVTFYPADAVEEEHVYRAG